MRLWYILRSRARSLFTRSRQEAELEEELRLHLEREADQLAAIGLPRDAARQQALRRFGRLDLAREQCRDARGTASLEAIARDTRHAARRLARDWRFTTAAVLILALGIGANTAVFSAVNALLFRRQSVANPDRLVDIYQKGSNPNGIDANSYAAYLDMARYEDVFAGTTAVFIPHGVHYLDDGTLRTAVVEHTTSSYPSVLGLHPALGRWFDPAEDIAGAPIVAVVGYQAWVSKFHRDPSVIGRTIRIEGVPVTVVGVGPAGHLGTLNVGLVTDFWLPVAALPALGMPPKTLDRRPEEAAFFVKARLRDDVTVAQAQAAMDSLGVRLAAEYPLEDPGRGISVVRSSDVRVHPQLDAPIEAGALSLLGAVALVLVVACSNLATLLLVRGSARAKEISTRLALGATRPQLVRYLLIESLLLAGSGCVAGSLLAWWGIRSIGTLDLPIALDFSLDARVLGFAALLSLATGIAFGLAPALRTTRVNLVPALRGSGEPPPVRQRLSLRNALVVVQVTISVVLLGGSGVVLQMLSASRVGRAGFAVDHVAMVETDARYAGYAAADALHAFDDLRGRVVAIPGVERAAVTRGLPMQADGVRVIVEGAVGPAATGRAGTVPAGTVVGSIWASPGYFDTLQIPIEFGRPLDERDARGAPLAAVISESTARQEFGADNPAGAIGRRFRLDGDAANGWIEVVGIARDTGTSDRQSNLFNPRPHLIYRSFSQWGLLPTTVVARTSLDAAGLALAMQRELRAVNAALPLLSARTMAQLLDESLAAWQVLASFLAGLGVLGLGLAGIGLYAVVAFAVSRRSRDIGIRMALGARRHHAVWTVARDVVVLVGAGTLLGIVLTVLAITAAKSVTISTPGLELYRPYIDPVMLLSIGGFMALVGVLAAFVPARRAATLDPLAALRMD
jgi:predicted permease